VVAGNIALVSGSTEGTQDEHGGLQRQSFPGSTDSAFCSNDASTAPEVTSHL